MASEPLRMFASDRDFPWWSLAAILALTLLIATVTGCAKPRPVAAQPKDRPAVTLIAAAPLPDVAAPFDPVEAPPTF